MTSLYSRTKDDALDIINLECMTEKLQMKKKKLVKKKKNKVGSERWEKKKR